MMRICFVYSHDDFAWQLSLRLRLALHAGSDGAGWGLRSYDEVLGVGGTEGYDGFVLSRGATATVSALIKCLRASGKVVGLDLDTLVLPGFDLTAPADFLVTAKTESPFRHLSLPVFTVAPDVAVEPILASRVTVALDRMRKRRSITCAAAGVDFDHVTIAGVTEALKVAGFSVTLADGRRKSAATEAELLLVALPDGATALPAAVLNLVAAGLARGQQVLWLAALPPPAPISELVHLDPGSLYLAIANKKVRYIGRMVMTGSDRDGKAAPSRSWRSPQYPETPNSEGVNDWLFVTPKESKGWILDAICREIGRRHPRYWEVVYNPKILPKAKNYFFAHYWNYLDHAKRNPHIFEGNTFVWYTHPREVPYTPEEQLRAYSSATQVIFTCSEFRRNWLARGLPPDRGRVVLGGADEHLFTGHERGNGVIGLSSSYYERKNPGVLADLIALMPHRHFHLVGRNWEQFDRFPEMLSRPNFIYQTASYEEYPAIYARFDVFLSLAVLEGGPIPLLEAMMENAVPVASRTGFAPDLIKEGKTGFIFDVDSNAQAIAPLIDRAFDIKADVRSTVIDYSWDRFAARILALGAPVDA